MKMAKGVTCPKCGTDEIPYEIDEVKNPVRNVVVLQCKCGYVWNAEEAIAAGWNPEEEDG